MSVASSRCKGFVIHLARAKARRAQAERLVARSPCPTEILPAFDGQAASAEDITAHYDGRILHHPPYPFALNTGEVGCFLSHRAAWARIVEEELEAGLILEDDVDIAQEDFVQSFAFALTHIAELGYIQFQTRDLPTGEMLEQAGEWRIIRPLVAPLRTSAQLVSRKVAEHLLALTDRIDRPVDTFLQMHWITDIHLVCADPSGVRDISRTVGGTTLVAGKKSRKGKLMREIKRFRYRREVARLSKNNKNVSAGLSR